MVEHSDEPAYNTLIVWNWKKIKAQNRLGSKLGGYREPSIHKKSATVSSSAACTIASQMANAIIHAEATYYIVQQ